LTVFWTTLYWICVTVHVNCPIFHAYTFTQHISLENKN